MRQKTKHLVTILILLLFASIHQIQACSCADDYQENFCYSVNANSIIILAEVTQILNDQQIKISNIENLHSEIPGNQAFIFGGDGANCGQYLDIFSLGDTLILSVFFIEGNSYFLPGTCGRSYLRYSNGNVIGDQYPGVDTNTFSNFVDGLASCLNSAPTPTLDLTIDNDLNLFPNPVQTELNLSTTNQKIQKLAIYSLTGQRLMSHENTNSNNIIVSLNVATLKPGMYLVRVFTDRQDYTYKIVKQ